MKKIWRHRVDEPSSVVNGDSGAQSADFPENGTGELSDKTNEKRFHIKKFDLYIMKQFLGTFMFALLLLLAIVIIFDINEKLDAMIAAPLYDTVFKYFLNFLPYFANQFSPLFTFIAVIFFTSRLADHSEIIAILSSGISFKRLLVPYLVSASIIALASFVLAAYIIPPANVKRIEYTNKWVKDRQIDYGDNIQVQVSEGVMGYMARYDNLMKTGYRFSLEKFDGKTMVSRLTAQTIKYDTLGRWIVKDYMIRDFSGMREQMQKGAELDTLLNLEPRDFLISSLDQEKLTNPELREYIARQKGRGVANIQSFEIEYEKRYANIAAAFILTVIGLSLSSRKVRGGMGVNIGIGLLLSFTYILFTTVTSTFAISGYTSPRVAMWIPNFVYILIAVYLYRRAAR